MKADMKVTKGMMGMEMARWQPIKAEGRGNNIMTTVVTHIGITLRRASPSMIRLMDTKSPNNRWWRV